MASQFGRAPLMSPPALALGAGAALDRTLLQSPRNVRLYGSLRCSLAGARDPYLSSVRRRASFAMGNILLALRFFSPPLRETYQRSWL